MFFIKYLKFKQNCYIIYIEKLIFLMLLKNNYRNTNKSECN